MPYVHYNGRKTMMRRSKYISTTSSRPTSCAGRARRQWSTTSNTRTDSCELCSSTTSSDAVGMLIKPLLRWWSLYIYMLSNQATRLDMKNTGRFLLYTTLKCIFKNTRSLIRCQELDMEKCSEFRCCPDKTVKPDLHLLHVSSMIDDQPVSSVFLKCR